MHAAKISRPPFQRVAGGYLKGGPLLPGSIAALQNLPRSTGATHLYFLFCFYIHFDAFGMAGKFRGIHALNAGDAVAEGTGMGYK